MKKASLSSLLLTSFIGVTQMAHATNPITITIDGGTVINTVSDHFYGHNYWMWAPTWEDMVTGTENLVADLDVKLLRFGGTQVDVMFPDSIKEETLTKYAAYLDKIKAEPLFQVSLSKYKTTDERVSNSLTMLNRFKAKKTVQYVSIGNEPDIYPSNVGLNPDFKAEYMQNYTIDNYCTDYNAVAKKLKESDPSLKLIGLELSNKYNKWIPDFVLKCKDNIDMISLHYYPTFPDKCTYDNVRTSVSVIESFYSSMRSLIDQNAGGKKIPLIIGETNITWDGDSTKYKLSASPGTFNAALWFADFVGVSSAQKDLFSIMPWSISEGWKLGFIDGQRKPRPIYYIYQMFSKYSKKNLIHNQKVNDNVRIYGYKDAQNNVSLFAVNWDTVNTYNASFKFSNILNGQTYNYAIPPASLSCITFSSDFSEKKVYTYSKGMTKPVSVFKPERTSKCTPKNVSLSFNSKNSSLIINSSESFNNAQLSFIHLQGKTVENVTIAKVIPGQNVIPLANVNFPNGAYILKLSTQDNVLVEKKITLKGVKQ